MRHLQGVSEAVKCYQRLALAHPHLTAQAKPPKAYALKHYQQPRGSWIKFSKVVTF
ncbi:MAG: hypothetical protein Kow00121_46310 [Elainellaceae cyanobacterium]